MNLDPVYWRGRRGRGRHGQGILHVAESADFESGLWDVCRGQGVALHVVQGWGESHDSHTGGFKDGVSHVTMLDVVQGGTKSCDSHNVAMCPC